MHTTNNGLLWIVRSRSCDIVHLSKRTLINIIVYIVKYIKVLSSYLYVK